MHHADHRVSPSKYRPSNQSLGYFQISGFVSKLALMVVLVFSFSVSHAQGFSDVLADRVSPDWNELMPTSYALSPHDFSLMGDSVDPHTGQLTFSQVDVSLPGNSGLEVAIRREMIPSQDKSGEFANWHLAIPSIQTMVPHGVSAWSGNRCSGDFADTLPKGNYRVGSNVINTSVNDPEKWSNGVMLVIPGEGRQEILNDPKGSLFPSSARKVTSNGWYFTCLPSVVTSTGQSENEGEGFYGYAPDGRRYRFNRYIVREHVARTEEYSSFTFTAGGTQATTGSVSTSEANGDGVSYDYYIIRATEVSDQHGNWVNYDYDGLGRITAIHANDGRRIEFGYHSTNLTSHVILSVTTNPNTSQEREWHYDYEIHEYNDHKDGTAQTNERIVLTKATLPDGRYWEYRLAGVHADAVQGGTCSQVDQSAWVKHPDGARAEYDITQVTFYNGRVHLPQAPHSLVCPNGSSGISMEITKNMAVAEKRLIVPGSVTSTWTYEYNTNRGSKTAIIWPTNKTQVIYPDGSMKHYYHVVATSTHSGTLEREELYESANDSTAIQTIEYEYTPVVRFGESIIDRGYANPSEYRPLRTKMTLTRGSDVYTTEYGYDQSLTHSHSFGQPTDIDRYSNINSGTREESVQYHHDRDDWVMAQPSRITRNGKRFAEYSYDNKARITEYAAFGVRQGTYTYETEIEEALGNLKTFTDALDRETHFANWYRGTPRKITEAYGTADQRITEIGVDANGWVTSYKNPRNYTTSYEHDEAGRYIKIDLPAPNNDIDISYSQFGNGLRQTITQGDSRETTNYDGMLRPRWVRSQALDTGWSSYVNTKYDTSGRVAFTSFPSTSSAAADGVETEYDVFGRAIEIRENVAPYATTTMEYLSDNRTRTNDPEGYVTTTTYNGYGGPDDGGVIRIDQPEGVSTVINRDIFGLMTSVTQAGKTQNYYYDDRLLLCRYRTPEGGDTLYSYDAARDMSSYAKGQSSGTSCSTPSGVAKVSLTRDNLGRVIKTDYTSTNTPDILVDYDENDNVLSTSRGRQVWINTYIDISRWTYTYDSMDRPLTEKLDIDGRNYDMAYTYNGNGHMTQQRMPSGFPLNYNRDGLGRETSMWAPYRQLAAKLVYHPNGTLATGNIGLNANFYEYTNTLNNRQLPERMLSQRGSTKALDLSYTYDARGDITDVVDGNNNVNTRNFSYDGLSRLTNATGPWGNASYTYDALGNLTSKALGGMSTDNTYDSRNRLTSTVRSGFGGGTQRLVSYDSRGNITRLGNQNFVYDYNDQPISISGSVNGTYQYDGNLKRVKSDVNGKTIYNVYNLAGQLVHVDEVMDNKKTNYIRLAGKTIARSTNNILTFLHPDHLGSAQTGTDQSGNVVWREQYTPFGEKWQATAANDDQAGFTGHITDSATGLTYMQARYYDPTIGRFLSIDPVGFMESGYNPGMFNRYSYAVNNPTNLTDPTGMCVDGVTCPAPAPIENSVNTVTTTTNSTGSETDTRTTTHMSSDLSNVSIEQSGSIERLPQASLSGAVATVTPEMQERLFNFSDQQGTTVQVTSGVRTPAQNTRVGGSAGSSHLATNNAHAADIKIGGQTPAQTADQALSSGQFNRVNEYNPSLPSYRGGNGVHVDLKASGNQGRFTNWIPDTP